MKNKRTRVILITILASLLSYSIVQACSPVEARILVKCSNLEVSILAGTQPIAGETYEDTQKRWADTTIDNLHAVVPDCAEDLTPVLPAFEKEIIKWLDRNYKRGAFLDGDLILEPYSTNRDGELQSRTNNLLSCDYEEYEHIGDWLIVFETSRSYCYEFWYASGACPSVVLSLGHFLFYLVTNFSLVVLPYLTSFLVAFAIAIYFWWMLLKHRPTWKSQKLTALTAIILTIELFVIVRPIWIPGQVIGWLLLFYLSVVWYKQLKNTEIASSQNAG